MDIVDAMGMNMIKMVAMVNMAYVDMVCVV